MEIQEIQAAIELMAKDLIELGAVLPEVSFSATSDGRFNIHMSARRNSGFFYGEDFAVLFAGTPEEALSEARGYTSRIPDQKTMKQRQWQKSLGAVIDEGHSLGLPDEVMKPLRAGSRAMTDNLLEDQS